jgi:hypothetical protein
MGFEPMTSSLPRKCSTPELGQHHCLCPARASASPKILHSLTCQSKRHWREVWSGRWDSNPRHSAWKAEALPLSYARKFRRPIPSESGSPKEACCAGLARQSEVWWAEKDSNLRRIAPPDLQSGPFGRLGICPRIRIFQRVRPPYCAVLFNFTPREPHLGPRGGHSLAKFTRKARSLQADQSMPARKSGAGGENRTRNHRFTKPVLYH